MGSTKDDYERGYADGRAGKTETVMDILHEGLNPTTSPKSTTYKEGRKQGQADRKSKS